MRMPDLSPATQVLCVAGVAIGWALLMTRAGIVAFKEIAGMREMYPSSWTDSQCRMLGYFRCGVGVSLLLTWGLFLRLQPSLQTSWPFGRFEVAFITILLLLSSAWTLLLVPSNFRKFGPLASRFWVMAGFLLFWWGSALGVTVWVLLLYNSRSTIGHFGAYAQLTISIVASSS